MKDLSQYLFIKNLQQCKRYTQRIRNWRVLMISKCLSISDFLKTQVGKKLVELVWASLGSYRLHLTVPPCNQPNACTKNWQNNFKFFIFYIY